MPMVSPARSVMCEDVADLTIYSVISMLLPQRGEGRDPLDRPDHLLGGDQACAFELARRAGMARAPEEVLVVKQHARVVPAGIAGMPVDHAIGCRELVYRMGEAADQHDRRAGRPGEPGEPAAETDKERSMA